MPCKKIPVKCPICQKVRSIDSTDIKRSKLGGICLSCYRKTYQKKENNPSWKGGRIRDWRGYIKIYTPDHPNAKGGYMSESRLIIENILGRYLLSTEIVHHKNGIKDDNRIENLELLYSTGSHSSLHRKDTKRDLHGRFARV